MRKKSISSKSRDKQSTEHRAKKWRPTKRLEEKTRELVSGYPTPASALLPVLHAVQKQAGWLPPEALSWVSSTLKLDPSHVYGVATFYTMFNTQPVGRHVLEICTNISCSLMGAENLKDYLCKKLRIKPGQTTSDGNITLREVECLGGCDRAPVMLVDGKYHENLDKKKVNEILAALSR
ncbi:MAG: NADH-quinone oxidoreductase subunit NuoE [Deltaproteobacteria bacterium]|nr:MAG: NADH-quinone oxidoreductase subunit NuoE [Deltaproteobacteria bacterium]